MRWLVAAVVIATALTAAPASACVSDLGCAGDDNTFPDVPAAAKMAFRDGKYAEAALLAETHPTLETLVYAARARSVDAVERDGGMCLECLIKAEETAKAAIALGTTRPERPASWEDPPHDTAMLAQAYVELAVAIGFHARLLSTSDALSQGLAEKGREAIDNALERAPQNAWALAALGAWHLEIVHRAGSILAATLYGANEDEGLKNFRNSIAGEPANMLLRYHFALSLLALDADRFNAEAMALLQDGFKDPAADALASATRKRAAHLIETLKAGNADEIKALVHRYQGYPETAP